MAGITDLFGNFIGNISENFTSDRIADSISDAIKNRFKEGFSNFNFDAVFNQDKTSSAEQTVKGFVNGYLKGGIKGGLAGAAGAAGDLMSGIGDRYAKYSNDEFTNNQKMAQAGIRQVASALGPAGQIAAAASGAIDAIGKMTGTNLSNLDKTQAQRAGISGSQWQNAMNYIPGMSTIAGLTGRAFFGGGRSQFYNMSDEAEEMRSGYSGTINDLQGAESLSERGFFSGKARRKANDRMNWAKQTDNIISEINRTNTMRRESDYAQDLAHQNLNRYAGENYMNMRIGRVGLKLPKVEEIREILNKRKTEKFQNGGTIGIDTNILPEGSLHARLNHLDELNPDLENATKKGIPVMAADGGEIGEQIAEIERNELILRLEVTKQIEALMEDGSEEAMIKAGKILTEEIIDNTQDNTGQITEEVEDGK